MKAFFYLLCLLPLGAAAQKFVLLDRGLREPFAYSDSITLKMVGEGAFPLYAEDLPLIISRLQLYSRFLSRAGRGSKAPEAVNSKHCRLFLQRNNQALYSCVLQSDDEQFSIPIIVARGTRKGALQQLNRFVAYLRHNQAVMPATAKASQRQ